MGGGTISKSKYDLVGKDRSDNSSDVVSLSGVSVFKPEDFEIGKYISEGGYGRVHIGVEKKTRTPYALKFFGYTSKQPKMATIEAEIDVMQHLQGIKGLVKLIGVLIDSKEGLLADPARQSVFPFPVIVMELLEGGELYQHIAHRDSFSEQNIAKIFKGMIITMDEIHSRKCLHRDVKLENLMFATARDDSTVKIIDFGLVVMMKDGHEVYKGGKAAGSRGYIAPESISSFEFSPASDVWQAGCTLYMLLSGCFPFDPRNMAQVTDGTFYSMTGAGWDKISPEAKSLVSMLLVKEPSARIAIRDILAHPWLVLEASDEDLGSNYFARLKHLVLGQKLKGFFNDFNIKEESVYRRSVLIDEISSWHKQDTDFDKKLKVLKDTAVTSFKHEMVMRSLSSQHSYSATTAAGEMNYDNFLHLIQKANLPELGNRAVFNIFDTGNTGSVDMKDFLLTLITFKLDKPSVETEEAAADQAVSPAVDDQCSLYFHLFDIDDTGFIKLEELELMEQILFKSQSQQQNQEQSQLQPSSGEGQSSSISASTKELFRAIDLDENGLISYESLKSSMRVCCPASCLNHHHHHHDCRELC